MMKSLEKMTVSELLMFLEQNRSMQGAIVGKLCSKNKARKVSTPEWCRIFHNQPAEFQVIIWKNVLSQREDLTVETLLKMESDFRRNASTKRIADDVHSRAIKKRFSNRTAVAA